MSEIFEFDGLIAGDFPIISDNAVIKEGSNLARGAVLGKITVGGKCVVVNSGNVDGSEKPYAVLAESVDATAGDKIGLVYLTGSFNAAKLIFGGNDTADTHKAALRGLSIFVKTIQ